jgi:hypothetical protein
MKHIPKENIKVSLSVGFLASLQDRHNERYSKHEAFCYLLDKACEHYMPKAVSKEVADELKDFQFVTTKTQLAEDWHWHRATVRQFLEKLTDHGLILCKEFETKSCAIAFTASLVFMFTPHLYTLGMMVGLLLVASIYYPSSKVIFKAQCPDSGRHLAQCPEDIVNFYF